MSKSKLDSLVEEVKAECEPRAVRDLDWNRIEASVMKRAAEAPATVSPFSRRNVVRGVTLVLAVAASTIIYVRRHRAETPAPVAVAPRAVEPLPAAEVEASAFMSGDLQVGNAVARPGYKVHEGEPLLVSGRDRAVLKHRGVDWLLESTEDGTEGRARVTSAGAPLVLSLDRGVIEAQVAPVREGEAFAVDVPTMTSIVRLAVKGTHLRVARTGDRVVVDLTEGVIVVGPKPEGHYPTNGVKWIAPAHFEFDATDPRSLKGFPYPPVRPPVQLGEHVVAFAVTPPASSAVAPLVPPKAAKPEAPKAPPRSPRDAIIAAVRQCAVTHARSSDAVHVTVTSELTLTLADGDVKLAKFDPPLPPAVQSCAAETIYKTKVDPASAEKGTLSIPIELSY